MEDSFVLGSRRNVQLVGPTADFVAAASSAAKPLVVVSGAAEFVGSYVTKQLLDKGYYVRGVVRVGVSSGFLERLPGARERLQIVTVRDFHSKESSRRLADAFRGAGAVVHAAPVGVQMKRMRALLPSSKVMDAVDACVDAASATGTTVRRVVFLSTEMSVFDPLAASESDRQLGEEDWYDVSRNDRPSSDYIAYAHTVAEMKLWSRATRPSIPFTVCSLVPTFAMGPVMSHVQISTAHPMRFLHACMAGRFPELPSVPFCPMDVRDIAELCVSLLENPSVSGRVLACPREFTSSQFIKSCKAIYPRYPWPKQGEIAGWAFWDTEKADARRLTKTFYFLSKARHDHKYTFNNDRIKEVSQIKFRNLDTTIRESMDSIVQSACVNDLRIMLDEPKRPDAVSSS